MSVNDSDIQELVEETELVIYGDEFNVLEVNYKIAEKAFLAKHGRRFNEWELGFVRQCFRDRQMKDAEFFNNLAEEACEAHRELIMQGKTLDDGVESWTDVVTTEVKEGLASRGISYTYSVQTHPSSISKMGQYTEAAREL